MGKTFTTDKESAQASKCVLNGDERILPRIISRKPFKDDVHPLDKKFIINLLKIVPIEYLKGLSRIELRTRQGDIGMPFGEYWRDEKCIILFSLPSHWKMKSLSTSLRKSLTKFHADIQEHEHHYSVDFSNIGVFGLWFYSYVFAHELGHHYREEYKKKNSRASALHEEWIADLHADRLTDYVLHRKYKS